MICKTRHKICMRSNVLHFDTPSGVLGSNWLNWKTPCIWHGSIWIWKLWQMRVGTFGTLNGPLRWLNVLYCPLKIKWIDISRFNVLCKRGIDFPPLCAWETQFKFWPFWAAKAKVILKMVLILLLAAQKGQMYFQF